MKVFGGSTASRIASTILITPPDAAAAGYGRCSTSAAAAAGPPAALAVVASGALGLDQVPAPRSVRARLPRWSTSPRGPALTACRSAPCFGHAARRGSGPLEHVVETRRTLPRHAQHAGRRRVHCRQRFQRQQAPLPPAGAVHRPTAANAFHPVQRRATLAAGRGACPGSPSPPPPPTPVPLPLPQRLPARSSAASEQGTISTSTADQPPSVARKKYGKRPTLVRTRSTVPRPPAVSPHAAGMVERRRATTPVHWRRIGQIECRTLDHLQVSNGAAAAVHRLRLRAAEREELPRRSMPTWSRSPPTLQGYDVPAVRIRSKTRPPISSSIAGTAASRPRIVGAASSSRRRSAPGTPAPPWPRWRDRLVHAGRQARQQAAPVPGPPGVCRAVRGRANEVLGIVEQPRCSATRRHRRLEPPSGPSTSGVRGQDYKDNLDVDGVPCA